MPLKEESLPSDKIETITDNKKQIYHQQNSEEYDDDDVTLDASRRVDNEEE